MGTVTLEVWLYGPLAKYSGEDTVAAQCAPTLPEGSTVRDLLAHFKLPTEERGMSFINGNLSALPGVQPDLDRVLCDGDRVAFFHLKSMWPFQYRHGVAMEAGLSTALEQRQDFGLRSRFD